MKEVQPLRGGFTTLRHTAVTPVLEPEVGPVQPIKVDDKCPSRSHTSTDIILNTENRRSTSAGGQDEDQESSAICVQAAQRLDEGEALRESVASLPVPDARSEPGQTVTDGCSVQTYSVTTRTSTQPNRASQTPACLSLYDLSKQTVAEETGSAGFPQKKDSDGATQSPDREHGRVTSVTFQKEKEDKEACKTAARDTVPSSRISAEAEGSVLGHIVLIDPICVENQGNTEESILTILRSDSPPSKVLNAEQKNVTGASAESSSCVRASGSSENSGMMVEIKSVPCELHAKGSDIQGSSESLTSTQSSREELFLHNNTETNRVKPETSAKISTTQGLAEAEDPGLAVPISLETKSEAVKGTGTVSVTWVSGSALQPAVSGEATLVQQNKENLVEEVEVQTVVSRVEQVSGIEQNKVWPNDKKQAANKPTEAPRYEDVRNAAECVASPKSSETLFQAVSQEPKIQTVVTEAQLEQKPRPPPVPQLEAAESAPQAHLQSLSETVVMDRAPCPAEEGKFLSLGSFQSLGRPKPPSNTLWIVLCQDLSQDVEDQGEEKLHITGEKVNIREVESHVLLKKEAQQSESFGGSQCLQDRRVKDAGQESGHQLNGLQQLSYSKSLDSITTHHEQTLPPDGTSRSPSTGDSGEAEVVLDQGVHLGAQSDQQEVSSGRADVRGRSNELSQVQTAGVSEKSENILADQAAQMQTVSISEQREKVLTDPAAELQTVSIPEESRKVLADQTAQQSVSIEEGREKVSTDQSVSTQPARTPWDGAKLVIDQADQLQTVGIPEESETVLSDETAELKSLCVPEQSTEVSSHQTELQTVNAIEEGEEELSDQSVQLQVVGMTEESETVSADQTADLKPLSVPEQSEEAFADHTELQAVTVKEDGGTVFTHQPAQIQLGSITEETEKVSVDQAVQPQTPTNQGESETAVTDEKAEFQTVSIPEPSEEVPADERTSSEGTTGGTASTSREKVSDVSPASEETVLLTAEVAVDDHKDLKSIEAGKGPAGQNWTQSTGISSVSKSGTSDRKQEESRTVVSKTSPKGLFNESRLGLNRQSEKMSVLMAKASERAGTAGTEPSNVSVEKGRFGRENWIVYGGGLGRERSLSRARSVDSLSAVTPPSDLRSGSLQRNDQVADRDGPKGSNGPQDGEGSGSAESVGADPRGSRQAANLASGSGRFGHEEWKVYGGASPGRIRPWRSSDSLGKEEEAATVLSKMAGPAGSVEPKRFGSAASDEWRVYGGSKERISKRSGGKGLPKTVKEEDLARCANQAELLGDLEGAGASAETSGHVSGWVSRSIQPSADKEASPAASGEDPPPSSSGSPGAGRLGSGQSGEWRVYGGGASRLSRSSSTGKVSGQDSSRTGTGSAGSSSSGMSSSSHRISTTARYASTGSIERKPVYSPSTARKNSAGSGSKLSGQSSVRISSSSRPGTSSATGGRVILSSSRPIRSTGSGVGDNKERISVCKMAALSMAAAGRGRAQDQQQKQEAGEHQQSLCEKSESLDGIHFQQLVVNVPISPFAASAPLLQQWLTSGGRQ